jgi:SAM-dependent methyltransferase
VQLTLVPRTCPICRTRGASRPFAAANVDPGRLGRSSFAARKSPEYMHWRLAECRACDLLYADPAPTPEALAGLYREAEFDSREEAGYASRTYASFLPRIARRLPDLEGAVDVGTGDGSFLRELLAAGFTAVAGVEPSEAPIAAAHPDVHPLIRHDVFRPGAFPEGSLSLVTCFQTIEHLDDPVGLCRDALSALKPGGALFLIGHNRRALSSRLLGRRSPIFDIEHLQLFSPRSLEGLLRGAGFERVEVRRVFNRYPLRYWVKLFPFPARVKAGLLAWLDRAWPGSLPLALPAGNLAAVGSKALT